MLDLLPTRGSNDSNTSRIAAPPQMISVRWFAAKMPNTPLPRITAITAAAPRTPATTNASVFALQCIDEPSSNNTPQAMNSRFVQPLAITPNQSVPVTAPCGMFPVLKP